MKKYLFALIVAIIALLLLQPFVAHGQNSSLWKFIGNLRPNVSTWRVDSPGGLSGSTSLTASHLRNCNTLDTNASGQLSCGTDEGGAGSSNEVGTASFTGATFRVVNPNFVNVSGDTMTGKLTINLTSGADALEVVQTASASILHAQNELRSSGTLVIDGASTLNGAVTITSGALSNDSIIEPDFSADNSPSDGDFLTYDSTGTNFAWVTPNAGTDLTADLEEETHATEHNEGGADALTVESLASSCTDAQVIGGNGSGGAECQADANTTYTFGQGLTTNGTAISLTAAHTGTTITAVTRLSGAVVHASTLLRSSGALAIQGGFFQDGLADCDNAGEKPVYNFATGAWTCGTDDDVPESGDFGAGVDLEADGSLSADVIADAEMADNDFGDWTCSSGDCTLDADVVAAAEMADADHGDISWSGGVASIDADTVGQAEVAGNSLDFAELQDTLDLDAALTIVSGGFLIEVTGTMSGNVLHAEKGLSSSGTLVWEGQGSGASLYLGTSLEGAGLTDCDADNQTVSWDATSKRFGCGDDDNSGGGAPEVGTASFSGAVLILGNDRWVNDNGDTMTGALIIDVTGGSANTVGLNVINAISGAVLKAQKTIASSGTLVVEGAMSGASLYVATSLQGAGLADCDTAGTSKLLWDATAGRFSCGTDQNSAGSPEVGTVTFSGGVLRLSDARYLKLSGGTLTGATTVNVTGGTRDTVGLKVVNALSGAHLHAEQNLTSSGALAVEGAATLNNGLTVVGTVSADDLSCTLCIDFTNIATSLTSAGHVINANTSNFTLQTSGVGGGNVFINVGGAGGSRFELQDSGTAVLTVDEAGLLVLNESGNANYDVRVEGDTDANLLFTDASADRVGIGTSAPDAKLDVIGTVSGTTVFANSALRSSGSLVFEGTASGKTLVVSATATVGALTAVTLVSCPFLTTNSSGVVACGSLPTRNVILTAGGASASLQSGATLKTLTFATNNVSVRAVEFGETGDRYAEWTAVMPDSWDGGTVTAAFTWTTTAAANDVEWSIRCRSFGDNEAIDQAWGTAQSVADTAGTANTNRITSATSAVTCAGTPAGGETVQFQVFRDSADAQDTLSASGRLLGVKIDYGTSSLSD